MHRNFTATSIILLSVGTCCCLSGCGTTLSRGATEQLLASDAVDRSVAEIDFRDLKGQDVYFDTTYIKNVQSVGFVNADYIISSLRQQMLAADCHIKEDKTDAKYIVEARVGALGADRHEIVWGLPANNLLGTVASAVPEAPAPPTIPEIAFAKKSDELAVAKIGVFAYHRESGRPIWQSGINQSKSTARNTTVLGVGPFQSGTIHKGTEFAGSKIEIPGLGEEPIERERPVVPYNSEVHFERPGAHTVIAADDEKEAKSEIRQVAGESDGETTTSTQPVDTPRLIDPSKIPPALPSEDDAETAKKLMERAPDSALLRKPSKRKKKW